MELWKVHKFCTTASLTQLCDIEKKLERLSRLQHTTNADKALEIVREYIELKRLFEALRRFIWISVWNPPGWQSCRS